MRLGLFFFFLGFMTWSVNVAPAFAGTNYTNLTDVLQHVYRHNPTLLAAREELEETMELYPQAQAGWLPTIEAEASIFTTEIESSNFSSGDGATTKDMTLSLNQPIWRGGRTFAETAQAQKLIEAGHFLLRQAEQDILLATAVSYSDVLRDREILELLIQNERLLMDELDATQERLSLGDVTKTDLYQVKSRLSRAQTDVVSARNDLAISEAEFQAIAGFALPDKIYVSYVDFAFPAGLDKTIQMADSKNPSIQIARLQESAAQYGAKAVFRELLPQLSAFASVNRQYDPQPGIVDHSETETVGLRATLALYQGGATRSRVREAKSVAKRRAHLIEQARRSVIEDVTSNWKSWHAAKAETENRKVEIEAAEMALKGVREESQLGQRTVLDILDAEQEIIEAKVALSRARRNEATSQFQLAETLGMLH
jgi:outer membrane protein